ncbi:hypothetical protein F5B20DRAFT_584651 [Whalleya microplaca]|nr:hypothetical protein F5B20DRAFT_584651 [Whalleya microplaca]
MAGDNFEATENFKHRYQNADVLIRELKKLGFKKEEIKTRTTNEDGLQAQLPRKLTKEQRQKILEEFMEEQEKQMSSSEQQPSTNELASTDGKQASSNEKKKKDGKK